MHSNGKNTTTDKTVSENQMFAVHNQAKAYIYL